MKIAVIYNKHQADVSDVINIFGLQTKETYNPKTVDRTATALKKCGHSEKIIEGNINVAEELHHFMPKVFPGTNRVWFSTWHTVSRARAESLIFPQCLKCSEYRTLDMYLRRMRLLSISS